MYRRYTRSIVHKERKIVSKHFDRRRRL